MQYVVHRAHDRGGADHGWLKTRHSFSFAGWYEPSRMGFGALRVLNDDCILPQSGFGAHPHRDMEIITLVTGGAVTHADSTGTESVVPRGDIQVMSAGTGVVHSERNASVDVPFTLFQIWIEPNVRGVAPRYRQASYDPDGAVQLLVAPEGSARDGVVPIYQDAHLSYGTLPAQRTYQYACHTSGSGVYIFVESGSLRVADVTLHERDALGVWDIERVSVDATEHTRALFIEVPMMDG